MMKYTLLMLLMVPFLCGCRTFGTFANLKKGETTTAEVRSMLGEPANRVFETGGEIWEYQFIKEGQEKTERQQTVMDLSITFKEDAVDDYKITASKRAMVRRDEGKDRERRPMQLPSQQPDRQPFKQPGRPADRMGGDFIKQFDKDGDDRVSKQEFPGSGRAFLQFDKNNDGYIDESEQPPPPPNRKREPSRMRR